MPTLADAIRQLESGGTAAGVARNAAQNPTMVFPEFGQYRGFVQQYGGGVEGINNYAQQTLAANPNATFGDFYAGYVRGTGTPGAFSLSDLQAVNAGGQSGAQGAFTNLMNNSPIPANAPLSDFVTPSGQIAQGPDVGGQGFNFTTLNTTPATDTQFPPSTSFDSRFNQSFPQTDLQQNAQSQLFDPNANFGQSTTFGGGNILSSDLQGPGVASVQQAAAAPDQTTSQIDANAIAGATSGTGGNVTGTGTGIDIKVGPQPGLTQLVSSSISNIESAFGNMAQKMLSSAVSSITNYFGITGNLFIRLGVLLLGLIVVAIALNKLMGGPSVKDVAITVAKGAVAA